MKIQGPNRSNFNPYQKQIQKQAEVKQASQKEDQVQISSKAKQMQEMNKPDAVRQARVEQLKQEVQSGTYKVNPQQTAQKMIDFWSNK